MNRARVGWLQRLLVPAVVLLGLNTGGCDSVTETDSSDQAATTAPRAEASPAPTNSAAGDAETVTLDKPTQEPAAPEEAVAEESTSEDGPADEEETSEPSPSKDEGDASETEQDPEQESAAPSGDVIVVSDWAAFTTPAQAAYCIISGPASGMPASISCEVAQGSVPPGEDLMGICDAEGIGWFFNFDSVNGHGGFFCNHVDGITRGGGNPHYWQDDPWINHDHVVTLPSGARVAVLDYGRVMRAGDMDCSVQPDGLTCSAGGSGRGFTVNSASYRSW